MSDMPQIPPSRRLVSMVVDVREGRRAAVAWMYDGPPWVDLLPEPPLPTGRALNAIRYGREDLLHHRRFDRLPDHFGPQWLLGPVEEAAERQPQKRRTRWPWTIRRFLLGHVQANDLTLGPVRDGAVELVEVDRSMRTIRDMLEWANGLTRSPVQGSAADLMERGMRSIRDMEDREGGDDL